MKYKICYICEAEKSIDNFYTNPSGVLFGKCKKCHNGKGKKIYKRKKQSIKDRETILSNRETDQNSKNKVKFKF